MNKELLLTSLLLLILFSRVCFPAGPPPLSFFGIISRYTRLHCHFLKAIS